MSLSVPTFCKTLLIVFASCSAEGCSQETNAAPRGPQVGGGTYNVSTFYSAPQMNLVYDLKLDAPASSPGQILAVCSDGYRLLSAKGQLVRFKDWGDISGGVVVSSQSEIGFAVMYGYSVSSWDWDRHLRWRAYFDDLGDIAPLHTTSGDLVGIVAGPRPTLLNRNGNKLRRLGSLFDWCFEAAEVHLPGREDPLVALQMAGGWLITAGRKVQIVDTEGNVLSSWSPGFPYYRFGTVHTNHGPIDELVFIRDNAFEVRNLSGSVMATYDAPLVNYFGTPSAYKWTKDPKNRSMLVLAESHGSSHVHGVYLYDASGKLVYFAVGEDNATSLLVLPDELREGARPTFLVGSRGTITKYAPLP